MALTPFDHLPHNIDYIGKGEIYLANIITMNEKCNNYCIKFTGEVFPTHEGIDRFIGSLYPIKVYDQETKEFLDPEELEGKTVYGSIIFKKVLKNGRYYYNLRRPVRVEREVGEETIEDCEALFEQLETRDRDTCFNEEDFKDLEEVSKDSTDDDSFDEEGTLKDFYETVGIDHVEDPDEERKIKRLSEVKAN